MTKDTKKNTCIQVRLTIMDLMALEEPASMTVFLKANSNKLVGLKEPHLLLNYTDLVEWYVRTDHTTLAIGERYHVDMASGTNGTKSMKSL